MAPRDDLFSGLLGRTLCCECGHTHRVPTRLVAIEPGAVDRAPEHLDGVVDRGRALVVADRRTHHVAGVRLARALAEWGPVETCVVPDDRGGQVHASVELVEELAASFPDRFELYAAVGSGTVNDLTKALAHRRGRPYLAVPTAASMNGYTSSIVALLAEGVKTTAPANPPVAVLADPHLLAEAPLELTLAGLGDLVSKPFCGCDWWLASLIRGEPHCPLPGRLTDQAFDHALLELPGVGRRDLNAVTLLLELLLLSGVSMTLAGSSSPASGGEHLVSHYWDMTRLEGGRPLLLHGAQVGIASLAMNALYAVVLAADVAAARFRPSPSPEAARRDLEPAFGPLAEAVWPQWRAKLGERSERDLERLARHGEAIRTEIRRVLVRGEQVRRVLAASGAPTRAADLGISSTELELALRYGRCIRSRFTVLDVAAELDLLDPFARDFARGQGAAP